MNRVQKAAVIIITLLLVVLGTAYGAGYFYFGSHFLPGTELNEFDVSFKTAAEVQDLLDQKVKSYAIAVEERNGGREKIDARSIGMKYKPGGTVQKLLSGQDRLLWFIPESSFEKTDLGFVLDEKLLEEQISGLDCMKKAGSQIPGIRPGADTAEYLRKKVKHTTLLGGIGISIVATVPMVLSGVFHISNISLMGTSLVIIVGVIIENARQIDADTSAYKFEGIIR